MSPLAAPALTSPKLPLRVMSPLAVSADISAALQIAAGGLEGQLRTRRVLQVDIAAAGLHLQPARLQPVVDVNIPVGGGNLDEVPEPPGQGQLHICRGQPTQEEEGGAGGVPLADGQHAVLAHAHLQVVHVAVQQHVGPVLLRQVDGHVAVGQLHVHPLYILGGQSGAGDAVAGRPLTGLTEKAAPLPVVPGGEGPALVLLLLWRLLPLRRDLPPVRRGLRVLVVAHVDIDLALEAVGVFLLDLIRHAPDDVRRLVHGIPGLAHRLPDDSLHAVEQLIGELPHSGLLLRQLALRAQAVQVGQQLVHIPQVLQGQGVGLLLLRAVGGQVLPAAVQVVAQLLDQLHLSCGVSGGGQALGDGDDKSCLDFFHGVIPPLKRSGRPAGPWWIAIPGSFLPAPGGPRR